jgi:hypothetical protein
MLYLILQPFVAPFCSGITLRHIKAGYFGSQNPISLEIDQTVCQAIQLSGWGWTREKYHFKSSDDLSRIIKFILSCRQPKGATPKSSISISSESTAITSAYVIELAADRPAAHTHPSNPNNCCTDWTISWAWCAILRGDQASLVGGDLGRVDSGNLIESALRVALPDLQRHQCHVREDFRWSLGLEELEKMDKNQHSLLGVEEMVSVYRV